MSKVIKIKHLSKKYSLHSSKPTLIEQLNPKDKIYWALKDINLTVESGERVGFFGPNGAGKTTLLKIISHITTPASGTVTTSGKIISLIELTAGFDQELTGYENIKLQLALMADFNQDQTSQVISDCINFSELSDFIHQPLYTYSSGMILRLAFSIATVIPADIFIVDEFLAVGDTEFKSKCAEYFNQLKLSHKTILASSHDLQWLISFCDKVYPINHGRLDRENFVTPQHLEFFRRSLQKNSSSVTVTTGSMLPTLNIGQVVPIKNISFSKIKPGDIIAFMFTNFPQPIVHRVIAIGINNRQPILVTKGDAHSQPDSWMVTKKEYLGIIQFNH